MCSVEFTEYRMDRNLIASSIVQSLRGTVCLLLAEALDNVQHVSKDT